MKNNFLFSALFLILILLVLLFPVFPKIQATECSTPTGQQPGLVRCGYDSTCPCDITDFFKTLVYIYNFIVLWIATPLAVMALIIGGVLMMISAGNPDLMGKGKKILYAAIIGLALVFCSYLIIDFVLRTIGYNPPTPWNNPF